MELHPGAVLLHLIEAKNLKQEKKSFIFEARFLVSDGLAPKFQDVKLKVTRQALEKLASEYLRMIHKSADISSEKAS
jgi:hypothetical protein